MRSPSSCTSCLDAAKNLLTIFCGVQETLLPFVHRKVIAVATWDRLKNDEPLQLFGLDADGPESFAASHGEFR